MYLLHHCHRYLMLPCNPGCNEGPRVHSLIVFHTHWRNLKGQAAHWGCSSFSEGCHLTGISKCPIWNKNNIKAYTKIILNWAETKINPTHLEVLQNCELLLFTVHFKGDSKKPLDTVEPQAVIWRRYFQSMEPEGCKIPKGTTCLHWCKLRVMSKTV